MRFRERIDAGAGGECKGTGTVTVSHLSGGHAKRLRYQFTGGGIESQGVLSNTAQPARARSRQQAPPRRASAAPSSSGTERAAPAVRRAR